MLDVRVIMAARALAGLSQADLAAAAGLHCNAVQRIERGGNMRASTFEALLRAFDTRGVEMLRDEQGVYIGAHLKPGEAAIGAAMAGALRTRDRPARRLPGDFGTEVVAANSSAVA